LRSHGRTSATEPVGVVLCTVIGDLARLLVVSSCTSGCDWAVVLGTLGLVDELVGFENVRVSSERLVSEILVGVGEGSNLGVVGYEKSELRGLGLLGLGEEICDDGEATMPGPDQQARFPSKVKPRRAVKFLD
jgi:hypothetical protein